MAGPKKSSAFTFGIALTSQDDTDVFKASPTLAAGDITVSLDGGNFANIGTLPTQIQTTGVLPVALTASEMNADLVYVRFHDAAGDEWQDALVVINTEAGTISEIAGYTDDIGVAGAGLTSLGDTRLANLDAAISTRGTANPGDAMALTSAERTTLAAAVWAVTGAGPIAYTYTLTSSVDGTPIPQADVWVTTDAGGTTMVARDSTSALGEVTFYLDAGTYYFWRAKNNWTFSNPDTEEVA